MADRELAKQAGLVLAALSVITLAGCGGRSPAQFRLNTEHRSPGEISRLQGAAICEQIEGRFGTPDAPRIPSSVNLEQTLVDLRRLGAAAGPSRGEADGTRGGLYLSHCASCHGISGDGAGPWAYLFDPYPRDFRSGVLKYTSTRAGAGPVGADVRRTIVEGIPATAMPAFGRWDDEEIDALVDYVQYLSVRGVSETFLIGQVVDEDAHLPLGFEVRDDLDAAVQWAASRWTEPQAALDEYLPQPPERPPTPTALAESIALGKELYALEDAKCVSCHGPEGAGDGQDDELYDDWNLPKKGATPQARRALAASFRLPIQRLRPRDFQAGIFHGGHRPEDIYRRIHAGIKGTPMPAVGPSSATEGIYTPEEIWRVVDYVMSLSR